MSQSSRRLLLPVSPRTITNMSAARIDSFLNSHGQSIYKVDHFSEIVNGYNVTLIASHGQQTLLFNLTNAYRNDGQARFVSQPLALFG
uniref:Uncharacterized protein n=1 Tax=Romanomermis culicivorax TaxID=13658 RepID=A0A915KKT2_ROMCU